MAKIGRPINDEDSFWKHVQKGQPDDCWLFMSNQGGKYVKFSRNHQTYYAHRYSYQLAHGVIPETLDVLHSCDTPRCVNPRHLFLGTQADNMRDMVAKDRSLKGEKHGRAKLTEESVKEIKRLLAQKLTYLEIANQYGVTTGAIGAIAIGTSWKHVSID